MDKFLTVPPSENDTISRKLNEVVQADRLLRAQNVGYINEVQRLREINSELVQKLHSLEQNPDAIIEAYREEVDRNSELEEIMIRQRRQLVSSQREINEKSEKIVKLRQKNRKLKSQNKDQSRIIIGQRERILKLEGRIQVLRKGLRNLCSRHYQGSESGVSAFPTSLDLSVTSEVDAKEIQDTAYEIEENMHSQEDSCEWSITGSVPFPRSPCLSHLTLVDEMSTVQVDGDSLENKWSTTYNAIQLKKLAHKSSKASNSRIQSIDQNQRKELQKLVKELLEQNPNLAEIKVPTPSITRIEVRSDSAMDCDVIVSSEGMKRSVSTMTTPMPGTGIGTNTQDVVSVEADLELMEIDNVITDIVNMAEVQGLDIWHSLE